MVSFPFILTLSHFHTFTFTLSHHSYLSHHSSMSSSSPVEESFAEAIAERVQNLEVYANKLSTKQSQKDLEAKVVALTKEVDDLKQSQARQMEKEKAGKPVRNKMSEEERKIRVISPIELNYLLCW